MYRFPIGVIVDSFRLPIPEALKKAAAMEANGVQMYCTEGEYAPEQMTASKKEELLSLMDGLGLKFSAICGDLGRGFGNAELNPVLIEKSKRIIDLAKELGTDIVTTHIGVVPEDPGHERYKIMQEACRSLAEYADSIGSHFAVETGPERAEVLRGFLDSLESTGVSVNLDPANLVMVTGDDPVQAVHILEKYIVHTHAKDGIMLYKTKPEYTYGILHRPSDLENIPFFREVPLGTGSVDFPNYLRALEEIGYRGFLTIEREVGVDPVADIQLAKDFLLKQMEG